MKIPLKGLEALVINLDRSRSRWINCHEALSRFFPAEKIRRVSGIDGADFIGEGEVRAMEPAWKEDQKRRLRASGYIGEDHVPDPVRVALCLSHQRALKQFLESGKKWGLIFEDDVCPAAALYDLVDSSLSVEIPDDAELVFLHGRVMARAAKGEITDRLPARHGTGLEAQLVNREGARKMIEAFRPMVIECDVQLMTFMEGYVERRRRDRIWAMLRENGKVRFETIRGYGLEKNLFEVRQGTASVKFEILGEARKGKSVKNAEDGIRSAEVADATSQNGEETSVEKKPSEPVSEKMVKVVAGVLPIRTGRPNPFQNAQAGRLHSVRAGNSRMPLGFAVCYFNPEGYRSRLDNFRKFMKGMAGLEDRLVVVELAIKGDDHELPDLGSTIIRLRSDSVLWHKEALLNLGMARLAEEGFEDIGWLDADVLFPDQEWYGLVLKELESKRLCQVFEVAERKFPDTGRQLVPGAARQWVSRGVSPCGITNTGYGWAMKREVWEKAGLYEHAVIGGGDYEMWRSAFHGYLDDDLLFNENDRSPAMVADLREWGKDWAEAIGMEIGYARGVQLRTLPHGRLADRRYNQRGSLLRAQGFDPRRDLEKNGDGGVEWSDRTPTELKEGVGRYFAVRREDVVAKGEMPN